MEEEKRGRGRPAGSPNKIKKDPNDRPVIIAPYESSRQQESPPDRAFDYLNVYHGEGLQEQARIFNEETVKGVMGAVVYTEVGYRSAIIAGLRDTALRTSISKFGKGRDDNVRLGLGNSFVPYEQNRGARLYVSTDDEDD